MQLIRRLKDGDENPFGDDTSATPKRILQLLNEASVHTSWLLEKSEEDLVA